MNDSQTIRFNRGSDLPRAFGAPAAPPASAAPASDLSWSEAYERRMLTEISTVVLDTLHQLNCVRADARAVAFAREDRAICAIDPAGVANINKIFSQNTQHHLSTALKGRKVVLTNTRGIFVQIAWQPEPYIEVKAAPIDYARQPSALHVPLGIGKQGPTWASITELDSVLIGGARRMGKTQLVHSWIVALKRGGQATLVLYDGKGGVEFGAHAGPNVTVADNLATALQAVSAEVESRQALFVKHGARSLSEYNARVAAKLRPIVLVIDEATDALQKYPQAEPILNELIARCGAFGVHPVLATQRPDAKHLSGIARTNLGARIALPVPDVNSSRMILNQGGAERLPARANQPNRLIARFGARALTLQSFLIDARAITATDGAGRGDDDKPRRAAALDEDQIALVQLAMQHLDGRFAIEHVLELSRKTGLRISKDRINALAREWEMRGWLTPVERDPKTGAAIARKVRPLLAQMAGVATI
jgi:hypothetical protein